MHNAKCLPECRFRCHRYPGCRVDGQRPRCAGGSPPGSSQVEFQLSRGFRARCSSRAASKSSPNSSYLRRRASNSRRNCSAARSSLGTAALSSNCSSLTCLLGSMVSRSTLSRGVGGAPNRDTERPRVGRRSASACPLGPVAGRANVGSGRRRFRAVLSELPAEVRGRFAVRVAEVAWVLNPNGTVWRVVLTSGDFVFVKVLVAGQYPSLGEERDRLLWARIGCRFRGCSTTELTDRSSGWR
jgi:hypothetical protein